MASWSGLISCRICSALLPRTQPEVSAHLQERHSMSGPDYVARFDTLSGKQDPDEEAASAAALSVQCPECPIDLDGRFSVHTTLAKHLRESHQVISTTVEILGMKEASFLILTPPQCRISFS